MRLGKMCYGLKQAAWVFHQKVKTVLLSLEFEPTLFDSCFYFQFIYEDGNKFLVIVCVYVDNFNIIAEREVDVIHFDKEISKALETRVEDPNVMLGIVFVETATSLQLNMRFQVDAILERYKMLDYNIKRTPLPSGALLSPAIEAKQTVASQEFPYPELTGSLLWIIRCTFLNVKYACNQLCAHMSKWDETHVAAAIHLTKYVKSLRDDGLMFRKQPRLDRLSMRIFSDANFAGDSTLKSTSAFLIMVDTVGTLVFLSKQQTTVSKSTMESEYRSASHASQVLEGLVNVLGQLGVTVLTPVPLFIDNTATIAAIKTQATSFKLRHLLLDHAYLRELCHRHLIFPEHIDGTHHPADMGTKLLPAEATERYSKFILDSASSNSF